MISLGGELIRICPTNTSRLEFSTNQGKIWQLRYNASSYMGRFIDLMDCGNELLATTDKGLYYSTTDGRTWNLRKRN